MRYVVSQMALGCSPSYEMCLSFKSSFQEVGVTQNCTGEILNDTTLRLTSWRYNRYGNVENIDELYYFKAFNNKPDSTSSFIK